MCSSDEKIFATTAPQMYSKLNNVMKRYTKPKRTTNAPRAQKVPQAQQNKYWLWPGILDRLAEIYYKNDVKKIAKIKRDLRIIAKQDLKPEKPESWYRNPKTWLSNWDIQNVMLQYSVTKAYHYQFLGVFPIDFAMISQSGSCMYSSLCTINIEKYIKNGKSFIGLITNLDRHDQSGSHWTSTYLVIDPKLSTYGAYYYDSTGNPVPNYLFPFIKNVKEQCDKLFPEKEFRIIQNKKQHQRKNTECGIFSMLFQIRWINKHIVKKNNTSFEEIIGNPYIDDENMLRIRDYLFRPNTKLELKKLGVKPVL
jgi:hypothetical protein